MRFAGSLFGSIWLFLYPALLLGVYASVFVFILRERFAIFTSPTQYVVFIFCGLIPYIGFADALSTGVGSIVANAPLVKNTLFPIELVPVKAVILSQAIQLPAMAILLVALAAIGKLSVWALLLPVVWGLQLLLSTGIAWFVASVNVFVRDLQSVVPIFISLLMFISPIAYPQGLIPANLRALLDLNPLYYLVVSYQDVLMLHTLPTARFIVATFLVCGGAFVLGSTVFMRLKPVFSDVL